MRYLYLFLRLSRRRSILRLAVEYVAVIKWLVLESFMGSGSTLNSKLVNCLLILKGSPETPYVFSSKRYKENFTPEQIGFKYPLLHYLNSSTGWTPKTTFDVAYIKCRPDVAAYPRSSLIHLLKHNKSFPYKDFMDSQSGTADFFSGESLELLYPEFQGFGSIKLIKIFLSSCGRISFHNLESLGDLGETQITFESKLHSFEDCKNHTEKLETHLHEGILQIEYTRHKDLHLNLTVLLAIIGFSRNETTHSKNREVPAGVLARKLQSHLELASGWTEEYKTTNVCQSETLSSALIKFRNFNRNKTTMAVRPYSRAEEPQSPMRMLIVAHEHKISGAPLIARDIAKYCQSIGMKVKVVVVEGDPQGGVFANENFEIETLSQRQEKNGVYGPTNRNWILTPSSRIALLEIIDEFSPNISIINSLASIDTQESLSSRLIPTIVYTHEHWVKRIDWTRNLDHFQTLVKKGLDRSNQLLFASAESLQAWKMLTSNECLVAVPTIHAFEVNPMLNRDSLASNTREKLGIPMGGKVILAVAVFEPRKRIEDVITAFLMLNLENTYLILVGQSGYFPDYEAMLFKLAQKSTKIVFHPLVEDVNPFYASADLFVHSSEEEVFPLVLQEASSWGLPIICSNYSGVDELLGEEYPFVFPVGDTNSLVGMIDKVLSNLELTKSLSQEIQKELIRKLSIYKHSLQAAIEESSKSEIFLRVESY